jgi:hypothetical protein
MQKVDALWFTGEHDQQLMQAASDQSARRRPGKLPAATQAAIDDINDRYPSDLHDDLPDHL